MKQKLKITTENIIIPMECISKRKKYTSKFKPTPILCNPAIFAGVGAN